MIECIPWNETREQCSKTIKAQYQNLSLANLIHTDGFAATAVIEFYDVGDVIEQYPLNGTSDGLCKTIKGQYYKNSLANFIHEDGRSATGIIEIVYETNPYNRE
jgi:hypothetical protein